MSKAALKKELKTFTLEQLSEVILSVYDSSKEAKAYLEFFLNPDPAAFVDRQLEAMQKELRRVRRRGVSKGRISVVKQMIKQGVAYGLEPEYVDRLYIGAISLLVATERYLYYPTTLFNGTYKLVADYVAWAEANGMLGEVLTKLTSLVDDKEAGTEIFRRNIGWSLDGALQKLNKK